MLKSMTGFGKASYESENKKVTVEIKSLNSKQADIFIKLPSQYKEKELILRNELIKNLNRGKIELSVWIDKTESDKNLSLNKETIKSYYNQLIEISKSLNKNIHNENIFQTILQLPDVIKSENNEIDENEWQIIADTVNKALVEISIFRTQEGNVLEKDFFDRIKNIKNLLNDIEPFEINRIDKIKDRIKQTLDEHLKNIDTDNNRFEQELIYYIEKLDITEEKVRLANHCKYFIETMQNEENAGKKLGFIVQEIGREINTIGSKANSSEIQQIVVQMKDELEKIKEQVLNIL
ncbi:MAG: YicC family protein [Bacteroidales bacterium]|nr:YicC family protein [Bacteroidales bacterium]MBN2756253.1 YicC family protein [Bacteroidales bacterium]